MFSQFLKFLHVDCSNNCNTNSTTLDFPYNGFAFSLCTISLQFFFKIKVRFEFMIHTAQNLKYQMHECQKNIEKPQLKTTLQLMPPCYCDQKSTKKLNNVATPPSQQVSTKVLSSLIQLNNVPPPSSNDGSSMEVLLHVWKANTWLNGTNLLPKHRKHHANNWRSSF